MELLPWALLGYLAIGAIAGGAVVWLGLGAVDGAAEHAGWGVRLILWPGAAALWPLVAWKWIASIRRGGPASPAPGASAVGAPSMRTLRMAHAIAWTLAAPLLAAGILAALAHRADMTVETTTPVAGATP
jgi:hypothetical protein